MVELKDFSIEIVNRKEEEKKKELEKREIEGEEKRREEIGNEEKNDQMIQIVKIRVRR